MHQILQWKLWSFKYNETCETTSRISRNQSPPQSWSLSRTKSFFTLWWWFKEDIENDRGVLVQSNEQVSLYLSSTEHFRSHYSQHNAWWQLGQIYGSTLHFSRGSLHICVCMCNMYGRCWLMNERRIWNFAEALMNTPKENPISDLQSEKENGNVTVFGRHGLPSAVFWAAHLRTAEPPWQGSGALLRSGSPLLADTKDWGCAVTFVEVCLQQVWHRT